MHKFSFTLLCVLFVISIFEPIKAGRGFGGSRGFGGGGSRHSYPSSRGHSGHTSSNHGYPSGGGLSGGSHGYPSGGGLSGGSKPQSHGYPSGGGLSGTGSKPQSHGYPSGGGLSGSGGSHSYPAGGGLSGSGSRYPASKPNYPSGNTHTTHTTVHNHYHYSPPQQIRYTSPTGHAAMSYPVYRGTPPTYVYQYKDSGSKYSTLLAGLALMNLGVLGAGIYASTHNSHSNSNYKSQPGEVCKFGLRKENGDYEETKIDCQIITSFIFQEQAKTQNNPSNGGNTTVTTMTVTNVTTVNSTNPVDTVLKEVMLPNGTLVMTNVTNPANSSISTVSVTTTTTNTTTNALDVKGKPIEVTPKMKCYVIRNTPTSNMRKSVECGLLQSYAEQSIRRNSAIRNIPTFTILSAILAFVLY